MAVNSQIDGEAISEGLERLANEVITEQQHQNPPASDSSISPERKNCCCCDLTFSSTTA
jgi:hypothetical protein